MSIDEKIEETLGGPPCVNMRGYSVTQLSELTGNSKYKIRRKLQEMVKMGVVEPRKIDNGIMVYALVRKD